MKFEKFVKSLGSNGVIYKRQNEEQWLASPSVFMRVPENVRTVTASDIFDMPPGIESIINGELSADPCDLHKAIMPYASAGIKDCIRIFATEPGDVKISIRNNDYALIERGDIVEVFSKYDFDDEARVAKALMIKRYPQYASDEPELVGVIFPIECDEI